MSDKRTYSEKQAAAVLDIPRTRLNSWRVGGHLRDDLVLPQQADKYGWTPRTAAIQYDADLIDKAAAGETPLLARDVTKVVERVEHVEPAPAA